MEVRLSLFRYIFLVGGMYRLGRKTYKPLDLRMVVSEAVYSKGQASAPLLRLACGNARVGTGEVGECPLFFGLFYQNLHHPDVTLIRGGSIHF